MPRFIKKSTQSMLIFYLMFFYILASFLWWALLFLRNNQQEFNEQKQVLEQYYGEAKPPLYFEQLSNYQLELRKKNLMIYGEGLVFLCLISVGFWKIRKTFRDEIDISRRQQNFMLSVTHELKSPLASIKLSLETLKKYELDKQKVDKLVQMSMEDVDRLEKLVENILMASKIESPKFQFDNSLFNLSELASQLLERMQHKSSSSHTMVEAIEEGIDIIGDRIAIASVIQNLLENAMKYSPLGSEVTLRLYTEREMIIMEVSDHGQGIPVEERDKIFRRFYRIGNEETRQSKGTGLGLFIVKQVVLRHKGSIKVLDNSPEGSIFQIRFPMHRPRVPEEEPVHEKQYAGAGKMTEI